MLMNFSSEFHTCVILQTLDVRIKASDNYDK